MPKSTQSVVTGILAATRSSVPLNEFCTEFFSRPNWAELEEVQIAIQKRVVSSRDVDSAITIISSAEHHSNTAFDIDELLFLVYQHATPKQAQEALDKILISESHKLQKIILNKGSHADILRLKDWQFAANNIKFKRLL